MKVILYMAISLNGYIATAQGDSNWTSPEDFAAFSAMIKKVGNAIIGRHTYDILQKEHAQFNEVLTVILTNNPKLLKSSPNTIITNQKPVDAIKMLQEKGFETVLICGGGILNSSFLKENLIDEMYIDIEPLIFGKGIPLFGPADFQKKLKLLSVKKLNLNTIQLHYQVIKKAV